ncbi:MAG: TIGR04423 family type III CRISPR-associated protein [Sulfurimonas sp.]|nr:TIGR04423 family type III CRISPR-associated protein [Sulfurimonas sp.]
MKKEDIVKIINEKYSNYEGYVQFSHRPIDKDKDIFHNGKKVEISDESGFVYEAHFYNGAESIAIKQINDSWLVSVTQLSEVQNPEADIKTYHAINGLKVKMAQIWKEAEDELCEDMKVLKLKKVVFAGFAKGDDK